MRKHDTKPNGGITDQYFPKSQGYKHQERPQKTGENREIQISDPGELTTKWNVGSWSRTWSKKRTVVEKLVKFKQSVV